MTITDLMTSGFEDIGLIVRFGKRLDHLLGKKVQRIDEGTFQFVIDARQLYSEGSVIECFSHISGFSPSQIEQEDYEIFLYFWAWVDAQMLEFQEQDKQLSSDGDPDWNEAGIEDLARFGHVNAIDALAGGDVTKWEKVVTLSYKDVFIKQLHTKFVSEITSNFNDIKQRRGKNG